MNSSHEAMYYAVPTIVVPQSVDQTIVAKQIEYLQIGKSIDKNNVTVEKLRSYAEEILNNNTYKINMIEMSKNMKSAGGYRAAVRLIENFLKIPVHIKVLEHRNFYLF